MGLSFILSPFHISFNISFFLSSLVVTSKFYLRNIDSLSIGFLSICKLVVYANLCLVFQSFHCLTLYCAVVIL